MPPSKILVIYHDKCADGKAAAWCAYRYFKDKVEYPEDHEVEFYPTLHNRPPPWKRISKADKVYILDFAYSRKDMQKIAEERRLLVLDHHKSAEAECHGLGFCLFDMERSGAGMAWDYFFSSDTRPWLIDYIEDRDIWKWEYGNSREALAFLDTLPRTFDVYDRFYEEKAGYSLGDAVAKGEAIYKFINQYVLECVESSCRRISFRDPTGEVHTDIPIVNGSHKLISEMVHEACKGAKFGIGWWRMNNGRYKYSLRVDDESDFDVSKLAKRFPGGGGHVKAAGFTLDHELEEL